MRAGHRELLSALAVAMWGASRAACSAGEGPRVSVTMNEAVFRNDGATRVPAGSGCESAMLPAGHAGEPPPNLRAGDFSHSEGTDGDAFLVEVFSDTELLATHRYDVPMLQSRRVDEFTVVTHAGATYTLRYWGGPCLVTAVTDASVGDEKP
jgi:hypothetical protein